MPPKEKNKKKEDKKRPTTPSNEKKEPVSGGTTTTKKKSTARATPEDFPDVVATFGTNENKVQDTARDIHVEGLTLLFHGYELLKDTTLQLSYGQRYALVGINAVGKTTLLNAISARMVPIPGSIDVYSVRHPIEPSDMTALEAVLEVDEERLELEAESDRLGEMLGEEGLSDAKQTELSERLNDVCDRLEALDAASAKSRAAGILTGLGFTSQMQSKKTSDFSGGWRMRIALARALFLDPTLLILDGPTAHLDMEAVVWLEEELKKRSKILLLVSHSQDFMNGVCTQTILMRQSKLQYFGGNYATYVRTREEKETAQQKQYEWEQDRLSDMKDYIARFGHGSAKLARQAQSREKSMARMVEGGLTEAVTTDRAINLVFPKVGKLPPPVLQLQSVSFTYPNGKEIYNKLDFGADLDSRICLVGRNGAGKSTLLKLLTGELIPTDGMVRRHTALRMAVFNQHSADQLPFDSSPLEYVLKEFPTNVEGEPHSIEQVRSIVGRFGITGRAQTQKIGQLSDGQKSRLVFAVIAERRPHMILLDEPTNALDALTTEALADAINEFDGGVIVISHDFALVSRVCKELWICDHGLKRYDGGIDAYKKLLRKQILGHV